MRSARAALLVALTLAAGGATAAPRAYRTPRTSWGAPDLGGAWTNLSLTRLERPAGVAAPVVSGADRAALEARLVAENGSIAGSDEVGQGETEWAEPATLGVVDGQARTAWLLFPTDGRLPYRPEVRSALERAPGTRFDGPETLSASDRCLSGAFSASGPPMLNPPGSANYLLMQTPAEVVILAEVNSEVRRITFGAPRAPGLPPRWGGWSSGRWEGDTLVVETTGFHPGESYRAPVLVMSPGARVVERFTRVSEDEVRYRFEVDDPAIFTSRWAAEIPLRRSRDRMFESACHEGNYAMAGMLAGARRAERDAEAEGR